MKLNRKYFSLISFSYFLFFICRSGVYTIRGVTYLEGQYHEDRLVTGTKCQIFVEVFDCNERNNNNNNNNDNNNNFSFSY